MQIEKPAPKSAHSRKRPVGLTNNTSSAKWINVQCPIEPNGITHFTLPGIVIEAHT